MAESHVEEEGVVWRVRVLGRSGRASGRSPPMLLLGFWNDERLERPPRLEATVVGRRLADLSSESLAVALSQASPAPDPARRKSFFEEANQVKRK